MSNTLEPEQWAVKQHIEKNPKCEWICMHTNLINLGEEVENTQPTREEMLEAAKPLIKFINEFHPHHTIIVSHDIVELLESQMINKTSEFLKD